MEEHYWQKHQMKNYMPYNCSNCEESYFILDEYLFHSSTCNPGMQLTKYFCNTCPYVTFDKTIFLVHENTHGITQELHLCRLCEDGFGSR